MAYNPLGWERDDVIRIPVSVSTFCPFQFSICLDEVLLVISVFLLLFFSLGVIS